MGNLQNNKHVDPIFLLQNFNLLYMAVSWAKFEKKLDSTSFSSELPLLIIGKTMSSEIAY